MLTLDHSVSLSTETSQPASREAKQQPKEKTETEKKAEELANLTRAQGMGFLHGKLPPALERKTRGFIQGENVTASHPYDTDYNDSLDDMFSIKFPPSNIWQSNRDEQRQVWTVSEYTPPRAPQKKEFLSVKVIHLSPTLVQLLTNSRFRY